MFENAQTDYAQCFEDNESLVGKFGYEAGRFNCLQVYRKSLKEQVPILTQIYEGY